MDHIKAEKRAYIVLSVVQFVLGAYLIARPEQSFSIACYAIGTVLVVYGIIKWWLILIWAIAAGAAGLVLLARPVEATKLIMQLVGINLMIDGGLNLWVVLYTVKEHRNFRFHN